MFSQENQAIQAFTFNLLSKPSSWHILMTVVAGFMLTTLELYLAPVPAGVHTHTHIQIHTDTHTDSTCSHA